MTTELDNLQNADGKEEKSSQTYSQTQENVSSEAEREQEAIVEQTKDDFIEEKQEVELKQAEETLEEQDTYKHQEKVEKNIEKKEIPLKDYKNFEVEVLIGEAKSLLNEFSAVEVKEHLNQIREIVKFKLEEDETLKKEEFIENGGNEIDFYYENPLKKKFYDVYTDYRNQINTHYKEIERQEKTNLEKRLAIIEELKALYQEHNDTNNTNLFKKFRDIKAHWHDAGRIPASQVGNVFKTYFFHLDNFYGYLDLNKELRELDYAHNLEVRYSIIKRTEELIDEKNVQKALNELQYLHKLWKEEAVPVTEELREPTWQKFKELTNKIHERKSELNEKIKQEQEENLAKKKEIIESIKKMASDTTNKSHGEWQNLIRDINKLRENFMAVGRVKRKENNKLWNSFKDVTREFNQKKNEFYKVLKQNQQENLEKKLQLIDIANQHKESTDWNASVQVIKRIQSEWQKIGHVPRKNSNNIWKEFRKACNTFFDNYKSRNDRNTEKYELNYTKKVEFLNNIKDAELPKDDQNAALNMINDLTAEWNSLGKVPINQVSINLDFNKLTNEWMKKLKLSNSEIQDFRLSSLIDQIKSDGNERLLDDEIRKYRKLIDELEKEIVQLENNVQFFSNADESNPLLKDVYLQIENKRNRLTDAVIRLRRLASVDFYEEEDETSSTEKN